MPWWPEGRDAESQLLADFEHSDSLGSCELAVLVRNYPVLLFNKVSFVPRYSDPTHLFAMCLYFLQALHFWCLQKYESGEWPILPHL